MPEPMTRRELDQARCGHEDHDPEDCRVGGPLYLHARCHPSAGTRCMYDQGILDIRCRRCEAPIVKVAVAGVPLRDADALEQGAVALMDDLVQAHDYSQGQLDDLTRMALGLADRPWSPQD
jgi:hypothetical protein